MLEWLKRFRVRKREGRSLFPLKKPNHCMETLYRHKKGYTDSFNCINYSVTDCLKAHLKDIECRSAKLQDFTQFHFEYGSKNALCLSTLKNFAHSTPSFASDCISATVYISKITCMGGKLSPDHADIVPGFMLQSLTVGG